MIPRCLLIQAIWILWKNSWITLLRYTIFWNWNNIICINLHFLIASFDYRKIPTGFLDDLLLIVFYVLNPIYSYLWKYRNKIRFPLTVRLISWYIYIGLIITEILFVIKTPINLMKSIDKFNQLIKQHKIAWSFIAFKWS